MVGTAITVIKHVTLLVQMVSVTNKMGNVSAPAYKAIMGIIAPYRAVPLVLEFVTEQRRIVLVTVKLDIMGIFAKTTVVLDAWERSVPGVTVSAEADAKRDIGEPTAIGPVHLAMQMDVIKIMERVYRNAYQGIMDQGVLLIAVRHVRTIDANVRQVLALSATTVIMETDVLLCAAPGVLITRVHNIRVCAKLAVNQDILELVAPGDA